MRLRLGAALLALAPLSFAPTQATAVEVQRPAYLNIVIDSPQHEQAPPRWRVERLPDVVDGIALSPQVECGTEWAPKQFFQVRCVAVQEPDLEPTGEVRVTGRRCENPAVRAEVFGPIPNEQVTGTIACGEPQSVIASCTATASAADPLNGGFSGNCLQLAPDGPMPIRCWVDLRRIVHDDWRVTCYGTDP